MTSVYRTYGAPMPAWAEEVVWAFSPVYFSGLASNFFLQFAEQNTNLWPRYEAVYLLDLTSAAERGIPQAGSTVDSVAASLVVAAPGFGVGFSASAGPIESIGVPR